MPELPDVELYLHALRPRVVGETLEAIRIQSPSLVRTALPSWRDAPGRTVVGVERIGKRIVYATRELNDCAGCQTGGRLLADRALSRLLKEDWPKTLEDL